MSEIVHYRGTLKKVERLDNETLEMQCKRLLNKRLLNNRELKSYYDSYKEMLFYENYQKYVIHNDTLYLIEKASIDPDEDVFKVNQVDDRTYTFEVKYYNGGCSLDEAIEEAFKSEVID